MNDDECPHGGDPNSCPPCVTARRKADRVAQDVSQPFRARFGGHCPLCNLPIYPDQLIVLQGQRPDAVAMHEDCYE